MMKITSEPKYLTWIENKLKTSDPMTQCRSWCEEMQRAFPELEMQAGFIFITAGYEREHWWLKAPDGSIVDPTAKQYDSDYYGHAGIISYTFVPPEERPTGRCANCGAYCYGGRTELCSENCERAYHSYLMSELDY